MSQAPPADFVIVGEMKCGTTSVAHHLHEHPAIHVSTTRPVRFFDERWERGLEWYADQFADAPAGTLRGDDTPNYLFDPLAVDRLALTLPDARIIVLLREPIARAWSHWCHHQRTGFDRRSFARAVEDELRNGVGAYGTPEGSGYVARGCYATTVGHLLAVAGAERVHVAFFDDLEREPLAVVQELYRFLGVDDGFVPSQIDTVYNVGWTARSQRLNHVAFRLAGLLGRVAHPLMRANARAAGEPDVDAGLRERLERHYAPHLAELPRVLPASIRNGLPAWANR